MDEAIIPHFLEQQATDPARFEAGFFENVPVRIGEVVAVYHPDHPSNATKRQTQYVVRVQHRNGRGMLVDVLYRATLSDLFGGAADSLRFTLRQSSKSSRTLGNGSRVVIACPNGETNAAVIIGGQKHPDADPDPSTHHFAFTFNGVSFGVNEQGELLVMTSGATDGNGKQDESSTPENRGASITVSPHTGKLTLANESGEVIEIDTPNRTVRVLADTASSNVNSWSVQANDVAIASTDDASVVAGGTARLDGKVVRIGGAAASSPLVLGDRLAAALTTLTAIINTIPSVPPTTKGALAGWVATLPQILSLSKFTE